MDQQTKIRLPADALTGHAGIDEDHQRLVDLINQTQSQLREGQWAEATRLVFRFIEQMKRHFDMEEEYLRSIGYPDRLEHEISHRAVIRKLPELIKKCEQGQSGEAGWSELVELLLECLSDDIFAADMEFKPFLDELEATKAGRPLDG